MINEQEYSEIIFSVSNIDPILDRWAQRYGGNYSFDLHERLKETLTTQLVGILAGMREHEMAEI